MSDHDSPVVNLDDLAEIRSLVGEHRGEIYKILTPSMRPRGGRLGVNWVCVPPGRTAVPFHMHQREDEVFYVLSGCGTLRYGESTYALKEGDCVSCPAGTGTAHQIANTSDDDLVYLAIGSHDPDEVCVYPDSGKVMVRSLQRIGWLENVDYLEGEPDVPRIFSLTDVDDTK
jgi:uncharacterized cupin superfamily protein